MLPVVGPAECVCCKCYRLSLVFLRSLNMVLGGVTSSPCLLFVLCIFQSVACLCGVYHRVHQASFSSFMWYPPWGVRRSSSVEHRVSLPV